MRRWLVPLISGLLLLLMMTGCSGLPRQESWPGLIGVGEMLYAANWDRVDALDALTGEHYWSFPFESGRSATYFYSKPVYAEEAAANGLLLLAGFTDQTVYALALQSDLHKPPEIAWAFSGAAGQYVGSGVVAEDMFLIGNGDGRVYALNMADGSKVWDFTTTDRVWATPLVVEDTVYIASLDHHLYAVDLYTGVEQWRVATRGALASMPVLIDGDLWLGDFARTLYQIDVATQSVVWTYDDALDWIWGTPVVDGKRLYFTDVGGNIYALNVETRAMLWSAPANVGDILRGQPVLYPETNELLVPAFNTGAIYSVDIETGATREWYRDEANAGRLPGDLTAHQGLLYAMPIEINPRIRAFALDLEELVWVFPPIEEK